MRGASRARAVRPARDPGARAHLRRPRSRRGRAPLAIGLRSFEPLEAGFEEAVREARRLSAAIVAAHPHGRDADAKPRRTTRWFWRNQGRLHGLVDRLELFNRDRTFGWVASAGLPAVAVGDFHRAAHLTTWKTLLPCRKHEDAVVEYLRSSGRAYVVPWGLREELRGSEAA